MCFLCVSFVLEVYIHSSCIQQARWGWKVQTLEREVWLWPQQIDLDLDYYSGRSHSPNRVFISGLQYIYDTASMCLKQEQLEELSECPYTARYYPQVSDIGDRSAPLCFWIIILRCRWTHHFGHVLLEQNVTGTSNMHNPVNLECLIPYAQARSALPA